MMSLLHEELSYRLRGGLFEVHNEVGLGRSEEIYHQAFVSWLTENHIPFESKPRHELKLKGLTAHTLFPDIVIDHQIVVELKAKPTILAEGEKAQLVDYLKCRGNRLGLFVNMGLDRVFVDRYVFDQPDYSLECDWSEWEQLECPLTQTARECLDNIYSEHQTGYSGHVIEKLLSASFSRLPFNLKHKPIAEASYKEDFLGTSPLDCLVVDGQLIVCHTALYDDNNFNRSRTRSFMYALNAPLGLAANFGKKSLQIKAFKS